jgi:hypothetical protein
MGFGWGGTVDSDDELIDQIGTGGGTRDGGDLEEMLDKWNEETNRK